MAREHEERKRGGEASIKEEAKKEHESEAEERKEHEKRARGGAMHATHAGMRSASDGNEMENFGPAPGHPEDKHGGGAKYHEEKPEHHRRRRRGGKSEAEDGEGRVKAQEYNAQGSNEMHEAGDETPGFRKGGHKKRRDGGHAEGKMERERLDRRPRRAAGGRLHDPYSSASAFKEPERGTPAERGMEGGELKQP